jgi:hypothetical protein
MDRLLRIEADQYAARMQAEVGRVLLRVADAVNNAPDGNVISGSEMQARDALREFSRLAVETAVQMRIDSTESSFSPSHQCAGPASGGQGSRSAKHEHSQRPAGPVA